MKESCGILICRKCSLLFCDHLSSHIPPAEGSSCGDESVNIIVKHLVMKVLKIKNFFFQFCLDGKCIEDPGMYDWFYKMNYCWKNKMHWTMMIVIKKVYNDLSGSTWLYFMFVIKYEYVIVIIVLNLKRPRKRKTKYILYYIFWYVSK